MSCADVQTIQSGNGTKTQFSFDFPYIFKSEIHVYFWNATTKEWDEKLTTDATYPWQIDDANPTIVEFTGTAPPNKTDQVLGENEDYVDNVKIRRVTNTDDIRALFNPGSAIRSDDLNKNFEQLRYALQEANCPGVPEDVEEYLKDYYWDRFDNTIYDGNPWVSDDTKIATTEAIDDRVDAKIDTAITTDITGADGIDVRPNFPNGTTVIGIQEGGVDANRLLEDDIIIESEGLTETQSGAFNDDRLVSAATAEHRYRNYVTQPGASALSTTNKLKGQVWFQNDADKTVSIFNGTSWVAVASGGDFTVQPTTIYVDRYSGNDTNNGRRIINQVRTIKRALELANDGDYISIAPGVYQEQLPLDITQKNLSIVGDSIRSVFVQPLSNCESKMQDPYQTMEAEQTVGAGTTNPDYWNVNQQNYVDAVMFRCNSGTYISNMTFVGMKADTTGADPHPIDAYNVSTNPTGLPGYQGWIIGFLPGAQITKSPYIQNCTNFTDSQILNSNYREDYSNPMPGDWDQRVAYSTTDIAAGTAGDLTSEFTGGGIIIDGAKPAYDSKLRSMVADSFTQVGLKGPGIFVTNNGYTQLTSSYSFFGHYHLKAHNGGQANLAASTTDFGDYALVADGKSPSAIFTAQVNQTSGYPVGSDKIKIDDISSFTIGGGGTGVPSTNMVVQIGSVVYPITNWNSTTGEITIFRANQTNASLNDGLQFFVSNNTTVSFYFRSMVASSGHTMEYAGSGTDYRALPENGGTPDETKQITELDGGKIWAVIVDHQGKFKAGDFEVDQQTGSVSLPQGSLGIPLLIQTLDTANETVKSTAQNGIQIGSNVDLNNYKIVGLGTPGQNTDAANKQYTDGKVGEVDVTLPITKTTATANGVKTVTLDINAATTSAAGIVQLNTATDSTSTTTAATASAVKAAYDHADTANTTADAALPKTGGAMSGNIDLNQNIGITFDNGSGPGTAGSITGITDTTNTNSSTVVASAAAVKEAYDLAAGALPTDGTGQMTGDLNLNSNDITNGGAIAAASVTTTGNIVIGGNLQVDGTTTTVNSTEITLDDKNLTLSSIVGEDFVGNTTNNSPTITGVSDDDFAKVIDNMLVTGTGVPANTYIVSHQTVNNVNEVTVSNNITATNSNITFSQPGPSDLYSNGGGVTVKGTTDKTFNYVESSTSWTSSENINLASGKDYKINGSSVLNATTLGSTVTGSSLTSVGTIGTGTWNGTTIGVDYGGTGQTSYTDGELLIGNSTGNTLSKATITGGDGITVTNGTGSISLAADLKANGGLVTEGQDNEIAVDLGASSITGTLAAADGGTGQTSYADGELLIGNSSGTTLSKATLTAGTNVNITNGNGSITIAATDTNTTYTAGDGLDLTNTEFSVDLAANGGLEISNTELQVDSSVARSTGDTFTGNLFLSETSGNVLNTLAFKELAANGSHFVGFKAPSAIAADVTWTLPAADGATTQILSTDGAGILYWQTPTPETLKGGGTNRVFFENDQAVTANYSITLGKNAMSAGPLAVNPSVTITIPPGSTWTIV
jgi:hypothetical protein